MEQELLAQKIMSEIARLHNKLFEGGFSNKKITADTTSEVINGKLVYTDTLKAGNTVLAQATRIDSRPLAEIEKQLAAEKAKILEQQNLLVEKIDTVLEQVSEKHDRIETQGRSQIENNLLK